MRLSIAGVFLLALVLLWKVLPADEWLGRAVFNMFDLGNWGVLIYFLLYVFLVALGFPTTLLNVGAGILFSFWLGLAAAIAGGFVTAMAAFLLVRYIGSDRIRARLSKLPRYEDVMRLMENAGLRVVILVRLNPFISASLKNYGFGLAGVPLRTYLLGTVIGQTPVTLAHVYLGWAGGLAMMAGEESRSGWNYVFIGVGVTLSVALLVFVSWYGRQKTGRTPRAGPKDPV